MDQTNTQQSSLQENTSTPTCLLIANEFEEKRDSIQTLEKTTPTDQWSDDQETTDGSLITKLQTEESAALILDRIEASSSALKERRRLKRQMGQTEYNDDDEKSIIEISNNRSVCRGLTTSTTAECCFDFPEKDSDFNECWKYFGFVAFSIYSKHLDKSEFTKSEIPVWSELMLKTRENWTIGVKIMYQRYKSFKEGFFKENRMKKLNYYVLADGSNLYVGYCLAAHEKSFKGDKLWDWNDLPHLTQRAYLHSEINLVKLFMQYLLL